MNCDMKKEIDQAYARLKKHTDITISSREFYDWVMKKGYSLYQRDLNRAKDKSEFTDTYTYTYTHYRKEICKAIQDAPNAGEDYYTGEKLNWNLIGQYNNSDAKQGGKDYKREFALMPTVDHINAEAKPEFVICSWRMNDAKNDLSECEFTKLCISFLRQKGFEISKK